MTALKKNNPKRLKAHTVMLNLLKMVACGMWQHGEFASDRKSTCSHVAFNHKTYCRFLCFCVS